MQLADSLAHAYLKSFEETGRLYDQLLGFANGASTYIGEIVLIIDPLKAPRFALPSLGNVDADPFIRHRSSELTVNESTETWRAVKSRLELDVDADLSDLIAEGETMKKDPNRVRAVVEPAPLTLAVRLVELERQARQVVGLIACDAARRDTSHPDHAGSERNRSTASRTCSFALAKRRM